MAKRIRRLVIRRPGSCISHASERIACEVRIRYSYFPLRLMRHHTSNRCGSSRHPICQNILGLCQSRQVQWHTTFFVLPLPPLFLYLGTFTEYFASTKLQLAPHSTRFRSGAPPTCLTYNTLLELDFPSFHSPHLVSAIHFLTPAASCTLEGWRQLPSPRLLFVGTRKIT